MKSRRSVHGLLLLDKPLGATSNAVLQRVKRLFQAQKAGHTGSLDPLATGMLPICFGQATKFAQFLIDDDKAYTVIAQLGVRTDSGDLDGVVVEEQPVPYLSGTQVSEVLESFIGPSSQIPPMHSAVKVDGKRLYKLARKGKEIERPARNIHIQSIDFDIQAYDPTALELHFQVRCSKGTYIRTLVEDIAKALGTCAHVTLLHRHAVGRFESAQLVSFEQLEQCLSEEGIEALSKWLIPVERGLPEWPKVQLNDLHTLHFKQGRICPCDIQDPQPWVQVFTDQDKFVGLGSIKEAHQIKPKRLLCTKHIESLSSQ